jgi:hypothetical protein
MELPKTRHIEGLYISAKTLRRHFRTAVYESITQTHFLKPLSTISALANQTHHQDAIIARFTLLNSGSIPLAYARVAFANRIIKNAGALRFFHKF